jgi:hypothetical protein
MHVAGDDLALGRDYANKGALQFFFGIAQSIEQGAVGGGGYAFFCNVTAHREILLK